MYKIFDTYTENLVIIENRFSESYEWIQNILAYTILDNNLNWKAGRNTYMLYKKLCLNSRQRNNVIHSHLGYPNLIWGEAPFKHT